MYQQTLNFPAILIALISVSCSTTGIQGPVESPVEPSKPLKEEQVVRPRAKTKQQKFRYRPAVSNLIAKARKELAIGHFETSQAYLERAYRIDFRDPRVLFWMGKVLYSQGQYQQSEQWALKSLGLFREGSRIERRRAWELVSQCRLRTGDYEGANQAIDEANKIR